MTADALIFLGVIIAALAAMELLSRGLPSRCQGWCSTYGTSKNFSGKDAVKRIALIVAFLVALSAPAWAGNQAGTDAYMRGDYASALKELRPFAEPAGAEVQGWHQIAGHLVDYGPRFNLDEIERDPPSAGSEAAPTEHMSGRFGVQLGAYHRPANADKSWGQLRDAHPDLLGDLGAAIMYTDLGTEEAAINRLVVGAFETKAAAQELCDRLKRRNVDCFVPRP